MRKTIRFMGALVALSFATAALAGRWDSSFERVGQIASTSPTSANLTLSRAGEYVKVRCNVAAYIGQGVGGSTACTSTSCDNYAAGDPFLVQMTGSEDTVAVLAVSGTATCQVFRAKN